MIKAKFNKRIHSYEFVNERILQLRCKLQRGYLTVLAVYDLQEGKTKQTQGIYEILQDQIGKISKNDYIFDAGDYNGRVRNYPIAGILGQMLKLLLTVIDTN